MNPFVIMMILVYSSPGLNVGGFGDTQSSLEIHSQFT